MEVVFRKYQGLGNDFLVVDDPALIAALGPAEARALCDRHLGVGGDGVLLTGVREGRPFMRVINADGTTPQMCGNGVRCVALHLFEGGYVTDAPFDLDTDAGPHRVQVHAPGPVGDVEVWMRSPSLAPRDLPLTAEAPWRDEPIEVAGERLRVTAVSMGNPHAVTFDPVPRERVGPALEIDARFPERVNVGFVSNIRPGGFDLAVWERGVGFTQACGTGACAAAVAAVETGRAPRGEALRVVLPGGPLLITVGEPDAPVRMRGPAARVFDGVARV
ncbi:MAG: diaminopimelate epimerase [Sandaracinaceae bacterium]|nr:MAG: diaminopimelate epimerase [Sandaracinaceae bacterium]